ncbi:MAG: DUF547 domain-containing protein [Verrucomicrobia bacterium]|nr:DUF547 domain-containing protein [Verrucomicrobiota bacterium]
MKTSLILLLILTPMAMCLAADFSDAAYARTLAAHVSDAGRVNYASLKANRADLDRYVLQLAELPNAEYLGWPEKRKIAFWLNAYNALTLRVIIDSYPLRSIMDLGVDEVSVWDRVRFEVAGENLTLNDIEHRRLRAEFDEPRIHMALVCASKGCPLLRNRPYTADDLDLQLDDQAFKFLRDPENLHIEREQSVVYLSSIFDWFSGDFTKQYGDVRLGQRLSAGENAVVHFILLYLEPPQQEFLAIAPYAIRYLDYDWSLNDQ